MHVDRFHARADSNSGSWGATDRRHSMRRVTSESLNSDSPGRRADSRVIGSRADYRSLYFRAHPGWRPGPINGSAGAHK